MKGLGEAADLFSFPVSHQYMGCVEVLQSMRALDFNTRTQVTRLVGRHVDCGSPRISEALGRRRREVGHLVVTLVVPYLWVVRRIKRKLCLSMNEKRQLLPGAPLLIQPWGLWERW